MTVTGRKERRQVVTRRLPILIAATWLTTRRPAHGK